MNARVLRVGMEPHVTTHSIPTVARVRLVTQATTAKLVGLNSVYDIF